MMPQSAIPNILSLLTFLPLIGAIVVMCLPRPKDLPEDHGHGEGETHHEAAHGSNATLPEDPARSLVNGVSLGFALLTFFLSLALFATFRAGYQNPVTRSSMQFLEDFNWISFGNVHIHYRMG